AHVAQEGGAAGGATDLLVRPAAAELVREDSPRLAVPEAQHGELVARVRAVEPCHRRVDDLVARGARREGQRLGEVDAEDRARAPAVRAAYVDLGVRQSF